METEIISNLVTVSPVIGVLIWVVLDFRKEKKYLIKENKTLQDELRASEKEAISVVSVLNITLKELVTEIKNK